MINENQKPNENKETTLENRIKNKSNAKFPQADPEYATLEQLNVEASVRAGTDFTIFNHFEKWKDAQTQQINDLTANKTARTYVDFRDQMILSESKTYTTNAFKYKQDRLVAGDNITITEDSIISAIGGGSSDVDKKYVDDQDALKADITYVDSQDKIKQNIEDSSLETVDKKVVGAINELKLIKTDFTYVDGQLFNKQFKIDSSLNTTDKNVVGAINELQKQISEISANFSWKPVNITGAKTRNVTVVGNLKVNTTYKIAFTWDDNPNSNICYKEYLHINSQNTDIERYIHSSVIGLLPNVLALGNNGNKGFRIYSAIGVQATDGFIIAVYALD